MFIGIDVGSTWIKAALLCPESFSVNNISELQTPLPLKSEYDNSYEVDVNELSALVKDIIDEKITNFKNIQGILLSTQMHGFILSNKDSARPVSGYISWQDKRSLNVIDNENITYLEKLKKILPIDYTVKSGVYPKPELALSNLYCYIQTLKKPVKQVMFHTLGSFLIYRITGEYKCHITNAAPTGMVNITDKEWNSEIINTINFDYLVYPQIIKCIKPSGYYTKGGNNIPIYGDYGDHQMSVLGTLTKPEKQAVITMGTAGLISVPTKSVNKGNYESRPFLEDYYLKTICRLPGGRNIKVIIDFLIDAIEKITGERLKQQQIFEKLNRISETQEEGLPTIDLGFFGKQRGVSMGAISDIYFDNFTADNILKAAYRKIVEIYASELKASLSKNEIIDSICLSGGAINNNNYLYNEFKKALPYEIINITNNFSELSGLLRISMLITGDCKTWQETLKEQIIIE